MLYNSYVINLERRDDKLNAFILKNKSLHNLLIFKAIDGQNLSLNLNKDLVYNNNIILENNIFLKFNNKLKVGEIACFISHYLLWKKCIEENINFLIFEDDAYIVNDFSNKLNNILKYDIPEDCEILYISLRQHNFNLNFYKNNILLHKEKIINNHYYRHKCERFQQFYTHNYLITPMTCLKLCNYIENETFHNSIMALDHFLSINLTSYICFHTDDEPILSYASSNLTSDIQVWSNKNNDKIL